MESRRGNILYSDFLRGASVNRRSRTDRRSVNALPELGLVGAKAPVRPRTELIGPRLLGWSGPPANARDLLLKNPLEK